MKTKKRKYAGGEFQRPVHPEKVMGTLPPDPDDQNEDRSEWADEAIKAFQEETGTDDEDAVSDLLADLMHWCDRNGCKFEEELARAKDHYEAETMPFEVNKPGISDEVKCCPDCETPNQFGETCSQCLRVRAAEVAHDKVE